MSAADEVRRRPATAFVGDRLPDLSLSRSTVDRDSMHRTDDAWLAAAWDSPAARVVRTHDGAAAVTDDGERLALDVRPDVPAQQRVYLGVAADVPYFAVEVDEADDTFRGLREIGSVLDARDAGLVVHAIGIAHWHRTHQRCPRCGGPTRVATAGHSRVCEVDGSEHYPRTDPAVIMAVIDDDDRVLLGHQAAWPDKRFSTLAGFVEPGESLEAAVRREVGEEAGISVGEVDYLGSQPWPFPASLMLGFAAHALSTEISLRDGEISEARWFTRAGLRDAVRRSEVLLPPTISIARRLIEHWYGEPLATEHDVWR
jgi:NAD+ diphosphatase